MEKVDLKFSMTCPAKDKRNLADIIDQIKEGEITREEAEKGINRIFASLRNIDAGLK